MPEFFWRAVDAQGQVQEGRHEAASVPATQKWLRSRHLTPLEIREPQSSDAQGREVDKASGLAALAKGGGRRVGKGPVTQADVLLLTSELSIMLRAGLALDNALRVLIGMSHKPSVAALTQSTLEDVKGGTPFSLSLIHI